MAKNEDIEKRAYSLWEKEGRPEGRHHDHWKQAEQDVAKKGKTDMKNSQEDTRSDAREKVVQIDKGLKQAKKK